MPSTGISTVQNSFAVLSQSAQVMRLILSPFLLALLQISLFSQQV